LVALGQSDKQVKINIVDTITNILGNLIMIPIFGFMGAGYATMLFCCVTNPFIVWFLKKGGGRVKISQYHKHILAFVVCKILFLVIKPENIIIKFSLIVLFLIICTVALIVRRRDIYILSRELTSSSEKISEIQSKEIIR
jgi:O-antigen/teichoic acid export membrane protein